MPHAAVPSAGPRATPSAAPFTVLFAAAAIALALGACSKPEPPPTDEPPEPQATQLRDAIQAPIDKAKAVEDTVHDAAEAQRAEIEAAGG